jgi:hypothetical protein
MLGGAAQIRPRARVEMSGGGGGQVSAGGESPDADAVRFDAVQYRCRGLEMGVQPMRMDGKPVPMTTELTIQFNLKP